MFKQPKEKKCVICEVSFMPNKTTVRVCSLDCALAFAKNKVAKQEQNEWKQRKKETSIKLKTLSDWQKELEKPINKICCLIDLGTGCISCNGHTTPQCGHFHSVKSNPSIRYNLHNLHLQDYNCNCAKGSNVQKYDLGLINRYGKEYWEFAKFGIVNQYPILKLQKNEYQEKISIANSIVKELKENTKIYTPLERIELRKKSNIQIGIYFE